MIKIFTLNKNNKIELTKQELESLLNESYLEGYNSKKNYWTYTSPWVTNVPYNIDTSTKNPYTSTLVSPHTITVNASTEAIKNEI